MLKRRERGQRSKLDQPSSCQPCTILTESYTAVVLPLSRESEYREAPWRKTHLFWGRDDMEAKKVIPLSAAGKGKISVETITRNSSDWMFWNADYKGKSQMCSPDFWSVWSALSSLVFTLKGVFCNKLFIKVSGQHSWITHIFHNHNTTKRKCSRELFP